MRFRRKELIRIPVKRANAKFIKLRLICPMTSLEFDPINEVLADFRAGKMVIIVDAVDRENEGDLAVASDLVTASQIAFMMKYARGLICASISKDIAARLDLKPQVEHNNSPFQTPFAISLDSRHASSGVSASGRNQTIHKMMDGESSPDDFVSPGHIFPLIANEAGVLARQGQTEGSYDLARLSGLGAGAVICEILNPDGSMARSKELSQFAKTHNLKTTSIEEIIKYRLAQEVLVRVVAKQDLSTNWGEFETIVFENEVDGKEHLALVIGDPSKSTPLVRVHSECLTGDVFGSRRCDCGSQLDLSLKRIDDAGCGILLYLRQEGRGIGLGNKIRAYQLQDQGRDTVEANLELGFAPDERDFSVAAQMLISMGVRKVSVLTNNPEKLRSLDRAGISIVDRVPLIGPFDELCKDYLSVKREKMGHLL